MATYDNLINAVSNAYTLSEQALAAIPTGADANPADLARALLNAQRAVDNAARLENRVATALQTAAQAQSAAANK